ncbi:MAG: hypothetical protein IPO27_03370 [Bacteroidetes bacterium]|nr:hypothetical protein [Bacteroidota bacterium]
MKKLALTFLYYFVTITIYAQGGIWTWISGDSLPNSAGVFGTQGVPSVINHPPSVYAPCSWKDRQGNFWTYGGTYSAYSDLWKFNPATHEWTWVKGNGLKNQPSVYGTKGIADINNTPGKKDYGSATWVDTAGNFWIMGGGIETSALWKYEINTNMWTWVSGTTVINSGGIYGNKGMPSMLNTPGARRNEAGSTWTDSLNNLWLFGGFGFDVSSYGYQNDLWKYNITTNEWTWMKGDSIKGAPSSYGLQGIANPTNDPGARTTFTRFYDTDGNFWIFGGY